MRFQRGNNRGLSLECIRAEVLSKPFYFNLWGGAPAKFIKMVDPEQAREMNIKIARNYLMYSKWYTDPDGDVLP